MKIDQIILREVRLPLVDFFETSFGRISQRHVLLLEVRCGESVGWGECVTDYGPFYSCETIHTAWLILTRFILPRMVQHSWDDPTEFPEAFQLIRGHPMAKACAEAALWDVRARQLQSPLWRLLGGCREKIACGVSIGIQDDPEILLEKIEKELQSGYQRVKIKIKPGWDVNIVRQVRSRFPETLLMVDANSSYTLSDAEHLKQLDDFDLLMVEQPLGYDDLVDHSKLQAQMKTPICLDESIRHARDAIHACELGACKIINIKMGRVGGHTEAKRVHDVCQERGIPVWCGGMLETGIGRAHNVAMSTLQNFSLPGDVSASKRYFHRDTIHPAVEVTTNGYIVSPKGPGLGFEPDPDWIEEVTVRSRRFSH